MQIILISLACWRITYILTNEEGPMEVFKKFRSDLRGKKWSPLECFYCTSVWVAIFLGLFLKLSLINLLAVSTLSILIESAHDRLDR